MKAERGRRPSGAHSAAGADQLRGIQPTVTAAERRHPDAAGRSGSAIPLAAPGKFSSSAMADHDRRSVPVAAAAASDLSGQDPMLVVAATRELEQSVFSRAGSEGIEPLWFRRPRSRHHSSERGGVPVQVRSRPLTSGARAEPTRRAHHWSDPLASSEGMLQGRDQPSAFVGEQLPVPTTPTQRPPPSAAGGEGGRTRSARRPLLAPSPVVHAEDAEDGGQPPHSPCRPRPASRVPLTACLERKSALAGGGGGPMWRPSAAAKPQVELRGLRSPPHSGLLSPRAAIASLTPPKAPQPRPPPQGQGSRRAPPSRGGAVRGQPHYSARAWLPARLARHGADPSTAALVQLQHQSVFSPGGAWSPRADHPAIGRPKQLDLPELPSRRAQHRVRPSRREPQVKW